MFGVKVGVQIDFHCVKVYMSVSQLIKPSCFSLWYTPCQSSWNLTQNSVVNYPQTIKCQQIKRELKGCLSLVAWFKYRVNCTHFNFTLIQYQLLLIMNWIETVPEKGLFASSPVPVSLIKSWLAFTEELKVEWMENQEKRVREGFYLPRILCPHAIDTEQEDQLVIYMYRIVCT